FVFFFQAEDGIRDLTVTGVQTCALPIWLSLEPLSIDELSRIWGLFPSFNCRTSFVFRASPIWIDPLRVEAAAAPVISHGAFAGRSEERRVGKECRCGLSPDQ